jgi:hypothetical protein
LCRNGQEGKIRIQLGLVDILSEFNPQSVYVYQPKLVPTYKYSTNIDWDNWWSWNQTTAFATDRAYDYVHVTAAYWALYRVARNYPALFKTQTWQWYFNQAVLTVTTMTNGKAIRGRRSDETVLRLLLDDLKREGLTSSTPIESKMSARAKTWASQRYP